MFYVKAHSDGIWGYTTKKVLITTMLLILISMIIFFIVHLADPPMTIDPYPTAKELTEQQIKELRKLYGLDTPLVVQYFRWMGGIFTGDWGSSILGDSYYSR